MMDLKSYIPDKIKAFFFKENRGSTIYDNSFINYNNINVIPFDGEKTPYELGNPYEFYPSYYSLRARAWEAFIKTDVVQNAIKKYCLWVVGAGLKLQSEPEKVVLKGKASDKKLKKFIEESEAYFRLFVETNHSIYSKENCLNEEAAEALKNAIIAGDILCINRFDSKRVTLETIDGRHIKTPIADKYAELAEKRGNTIIDGVEIDSKNSHVNYYVENDDNTFTVIPAYGEKSGIRQAWLLYGQKSRKSDVRGMSLLTAILEVVDKLDRYKEATVGAAEENAKIPYTIVHDQYSDGSNPAVELIAQSFGKGKGTALETYTQDCNAKASKIAQTTEKQVYNLPIGAKLDRLKGNGDINMASFFGVNIEIIYSTLGIPPEVATDKFGGAYSGSRAALKMWEHKVKVDRIRLMKRYFYQYFYEYWLHIQILKNNINAPGYLEAYYNDDFMTLSAYQKTRFIGVLVPHIDPVKEVSAMRMKLGDNKKTIPLETIEQIMEELGTGDFEQTFEKIKYEDEFIKKNTITDYNTVTNTVNQQEPVPST